jgi:YgiT-type zinc finger domain-containing protein
MKCPSCDSSQDLVNDRRDIEYSYKGRKIFINNVSGMFCNECGECVVNSDASRRVISDMLLFNSNVDKKDSPYYANIVGNITQWYYGAICKLFGLTLIQTPEIVCGAIVQGNLSVTNEIAIEYNIDINHNGDMKFKHELAMSFN